LGLAQPNKGKNGVVPFFPLLPARHPVQDNKTVLKKRNIENYG